MDINLGTTKIRQDWNCRVNKDELLLATSKWQREGGEE